VIKDKNPDIVTDKVILKPNTVTVVSGNRCHKISVDDEDNEQLIVNIKTDRSTIPISIKLVAASYNESRPKMTEYIVGNVGNQIIYCLTPLGDPFEVVKKTTKVAPTKVKPKSDNDFGIETRNIK